MFCEKTVMFFQRFSDLSSKYKFIVFYISTQAFQAFKKDESL